MTFPIIGVVGVGNGDCGVDGYDVVLGVGVRVVFVAGVGVVGVVVAVVGGCGVDDSGSVIGGGVGVGCGCVVVG